MNRFSMETKLDVWMLFPFWIVLMVWIPFMIISPGIDIPKEEIVPWRLSWIYMYVVVLTSYLWFKDTRQYVFYLIKKLFSSVKH